MSLKYNELASHINHEHNAVLTEIFSKDFQQLISASEEDSEYFGEGK